MTANTTADDVAVGPRANRVAHAATSADPSDSISTSAHVVETRMDGKEREDREWDKLWEVVERIGERNAHFDPEEVERDIAEAIAEGRAEARAEERAKKAT